MVLLALCVGRLEAGAQTYSIDWHAVAGGGGTRTGGGYSLSATTGQAEAGTESSFNFALAGGFNTFAIDETAGLANADLSLVTISVGTLSPAFAPGTTNYIVSVSSGTTSLTVTPTAADAGASLTINGVSAASGVASAGIIVPLASNLITIVCTAGNGFTKKTYTLNVTRPALQFSSNVFTYHSTSIAGVADIVINRTGTPVGTVGCLLNSAPGTALAPAQYAAQVNVPVNFTVVDTVQHVLIPISANATTTVAKTFTVSLSSPSGGIDIGAPVTATVVIVPPSGLTEGVRPVVTITSPASNALVADVDSLDVTGKATDNMGVAKVQVSTDNGGTYNDAILSAPGLTTTNFTFTITPLTGLNTVKVLSVDVDGNISAIVTRNFTLLRTLHVAVDGNGTVSAGFVPSSSRQVGKTVIITATPAPGCVLNGWTGINISAAAAELPVLSFVMQPNLSLTAHFITNPFTLAITGAFNGLATPGNATMPANDTLGMLQNAVVLSTGSFTSALRIDGLSVPLNGKFDTAGIARFGATRAKSTSIVRLGKPNLDIGLQLDLSGLTGTITGTVGQTYRGHLIALSFINADRAGTLAPAALTARPLTLILPSVFPQETGIAKQYFPQGTGYATMSVSVKGVVSVAGKLADNTVFSAAAPLSKYSQWPVFAPLYSLKGSIAGVAALADAGATVEDVTGALVWFRPEQNVQWYPYGWNDGVNLDVHGARYAVPPSGSVFPNLQAIMPNATLDFTEGLLAAPVSVDLTIAPTNLVTIAGATLVINKASGVFTGSFTHSDGTKPLYQGVIIQKGANEGGWGYFMSRATPLDYLGESGLVQLSAK